MRGLRGWVLGALLVLAGELAAEAELILPDPMIAEVVQTGQMRISGASGRVADIRLPTVDGVTMTWNRRRYQQINSTVVLDIDILVTQVGRYEIPAATVVMRNGEELTTAPTQINVEGPRGDLRGPIFAELRVLPAQAVTGQTVIIEQRAFTQRQSRASALSPEPPSVGDGLELIGEARQHSSGWALDSAGNPWRVTTWRWRADTRRAGLWQVRNIQTSGQRSRFGDLMVDHRVAIQPAVIEVIDLPSAGRPADYRGLVGAVSITTSLDRDHIRVGESTRLTLEILGPQVGLLPDQILPDLPGIAAYPVPAERGDRTNDRLIQRWDLAPSEPGSAAIPPFSVSSYDPGEQRYRRHQTEPIPLTVVPGRQSRMRVIGGPSDQPTGSAIPDVAAVPAPLAFTGRAGPATWWLVVAIGAGFGVAVLIGAGVAQGQRRQQHGPLRALRSACADQDLETVISLMPSLIGELPEAKRERWQQALATAERARYGDGDQAAALLAVREAIDA